MSTERNVTNSLRADEHAGFDPARLDRIGVWLDQQVTSNRLAGASVLVGRHGLQPYFHASGIAGLAPDGAAGRTTERLFDRDTLVRLYSMTKPVTTVAAMMLFEQGYFQLDDPIARYLPAFTDMRVWTGEGTAQSANELHRNTNPAESAITVRQLMTHTSGLTYGFMNATPVDQYYRDQGLIFPGAAQTLASLVDQLGQAPLLCQPGTQWNYSVATDVLGRLVEVWSGQSLAAYFQQAIFEPLGMKSTGFHVRESDAYRFADMYGPAEGGDLGAVSATVKKDLAANSGVLKPPVALDTVAVSSFLQEPVLYSGGGGLVGSVDDFANFCQCLLNEGEFQGTRLLGRKSVEFMRCNQLPDNRDMASMGQAVWSESNYAGVGFGLGFAVVLDPVKAGLLTSAGEHHWGGAASTFFWIDPEEDMYVILLTQLYPSSSYPLRTELHTAVNQALAD